MLDDLRKAIAVYNEMADILKMYTDRVGPIVNAPRAKL
jgi:hypothetical protein